MSSIGANCVADNWILTGVDWFESRLNGSVYLLRCFCDPLAGSVLLLILTQKKKTLQGKRRRNRLEIRASEVMR